MTRAEVSDKAWFEVNDTGLWYVEKRLLKKGDPYQEETRITFTPFEVRGRLRPVEGDNQRGVLLGFRDEIGQKKSLAVPLVDVSNETQIAAWMSDHGIPWDPGEKKRLLLYLNLPTEKVIRAYTRNGWQENDAFVVGDRVIGGEGHVMVTDTTVSTYETAGDYDQWKNEILPLIVRKPGWQLGLLIGLSSPLLQVVGSSIGYGFNLTGKSSTGKTVALRIAANVWGKPSAHRGAMKTWNMTVNGAEGLAASHSDVGLFLDEMERSDLNLVRNIVYLLANGTGKVAMKSNRDMLKVRSWRTNTFCTGEKAIEDMFRADGQHQAAGQGVRFLDLRAEPLLPQIDLETVQDLERQLMRCYGVVGPEFVRRLQGLEWGALGRRWFELTRDLYGGEDARVQRAAGGFALLALAGEIMDFDTEVVRVAFDDWQARSSEIVDDNLQIARRVLDFIDARMNSSILPLANDEGDLGDELDSKTGEGGYSYRERDGWYSDGLVWLLPAVLDKLRQGHGRNVFYQWCADQGVIKRRSSGQGWTRDVPKLTPRKTAILFDLDKLREICG
jgi:putative DNA primase/helicase